MPNSEPDFERPALGPPEILHENPHQRIVRIAAKFADFRKEYYVTRFGTRAGLLVVRDGAVLLTRQYRLLLDGPSWEIPGGGVDDGEDAATAAVRECLEETGIHALNPRPLVQFRPGLDTLDNPSLIFVAEEAREERPFTPNPREVFHREWVPYARCLEMIQAGDIVDSLTLLALLAYHTFGGHRHEG